MARKRNLGVLDLTKYLYSNTGNTRHKKTDVMLNGEKKAVIHNISPNISIEPFISLLNMELNRKENHINGMPLQNKIHFFILISILVTTHNSLFKGLGRTITLAYYPKRVRDRIFIFYR